MGIVSVSVGSNEAAEMENSEVLGDGALGNIKMAGKGINAEGFVIPEKRNDSEPAFNAQNTHQLSHLLKRIILSFHASPFQYISIY